MRSDANRDVRGDLDRFGYPLWVTTLYPVWCGYHSIYLLQSVPIVRWDFPIYSIVRWWGGTKNIWGASPWWHRHSTSGRGDLYKWAWVPAEAAVTPSCADLALSVWLLSPDQWERSGVHPGIACLMLNRREILLLIIRLPGGPALGLALWEPGPR